MINRELYFRDPTTVELLNNGVSKVSEIGHDERQIKTLRFELETLSPKIQNGFSTSGMFYRAFQTIASTQKLYIEDREKLLVEMRG